jgi:hypothetical protein
MTDGSREPRFYNHLSVSMILAFAEAHEWYYQVQLSRVVLPRSAFRISDASVFLPV